MSTPTAVTAAFHAEPVTIGPFTLQPFTLAKLMFLDRIKSPLLGNGSCELIDAARALLVMTRPIEEVFELWTPGAIKNPEAGELPVQSASFDEAAWLLADQIEFGEAATLPEKLRAHIDTGFSTAVPMRAPAEPGKAGSSPFPVSPASPADSAGS